MDAFVCITVQYECHCYDGRPINRKLTASNREVWVEMVKMASEDL